MTIIKPNISEQKVVDIQSYLLGQQCVPSNPQLWFWLKLPLLLLIVAC